LQELKLSADKLPLGELEARGYHVHAHAQATWNGVAVLSKQAGDVRQAGLDGADDAGARLVTVDVGELSVTSVYVPNGKSVEHEDYNGKLSWLSKLQGYAQRLVDPARPMVIGGDFNIVHRAIDTWNDARYAGHIFHTAAERRAIDGLAELGLVDMYRAHEPSGTMYSWWDYRAGCFHKNQGLRIDLLLATPTLMERATKVWVDRDYRKKQDGHVPSDHAPVIADLD
jgi:exodeoxyribonuclease-3